VVGLLTCVSIQTLGQPVNENVFVIETGADNKPYVLEDVFLN